MNDEQKAQIRTVLRHAWQTACQDEPARSSCTVEDGHFQMTISGNRENWSQMIQIAGIPETCQQTIDGDTITLRWKSHADEIFAPDGLLAQHLPGYEMRLPQLHMARLVQRSIEMGETAIIEAGTGVGKSFAYMAICMAMGKRVIVSTSNKALQMQLYRKDAPFLQQIFPGQKIALAVGKSNYACRFKVEDLVGGRVSIEDEDLRDWYLNTASGNTEEITFPVDGRQLSEITVDDNCTGKHCPLYEMCFYYIAKKRRAEADVTICNHALLALHQRFPGAGILPNADVIVVDEAHQFPNYARSALAATVRTNNIERRIVRATRNIGEDVSEILDTYLPAFMQEIKSLIPMNAEFQVGIQKERWIESGTALANVLHEMAGRIWHEEDVPNDREDMTLYNAADRLRSMATDVRMVSVPRPDTSQVRWVEVGDTISVVSMPHDVSEFVGQLAPAIFTSATIAAPTFAHFQRECGIGDAMTMQADSPFNYQDNALLYVPNGKSPSPKSDDFRRWLTDEIYGLVSAANGGALLLFTSYATLRYVYDQLRYEFERQGLTVLRQGDLPKLELQRRLADGDSVLFATKSFFEGISIDGDALRLVVIDKMPFEAPNPLNTAQEAAIKEEARARGMSSKQAEWYPFEALRLPRMILELKQGFGRLIRTGTDRGVVAIMDSRLRSSRYGRQQVLPALPPAKLISSSHRATDFLNQIRFGGERIDELEPVQHFAIEAGHVDPHNPFE